MTKTLFLLIVCFCFANSSNENLLKDAQNFEEQGNYKEAMLLYKKIAIQEKNQEKENIESSLSNSLEKNTPVDTTPYFIAQRKDFFNTNIDKTDDKETNNSIKQIVTKDFGILPYRKNYILPATYTFNDFENRDNFETSFQISIEKPILDNFLGLNETLSIAYTQKSFWQTASSSAPFRETNYEPEVFVKIPYEKGSYLKLYKIGAMHSSNGKGSDDSRSVNRAYLQGFFQFNNLFVNPKVWYRIPENSKDDNNKDFYKYYGYGDLSLLYAYKKHTFELILRNNLRFDESNKGAAEFNWNFPLPEFMASKNTYGLFQLFHGYGQSLFDYDKEVTNIGIGVAFSR